MNMRFLLLVIATFMLASPGHARDSTQNYTCEGVKNLVKSRGAIVLDTKNSRVFERFVANRSFCAVEETTQRVSVPTKSGICKLKRCRDLIRDSNR